MSLRTRVALAGAVAVALALLLASLVLYPAAVTRLTGQHDTELVLATNDVPKLLKTLKARDEELSTQPVSVGTILLQFLPDPVEGQPNGFLPITAADVQIAEGMESGYFQEADVGGERYRVYTTQLRDAGPGLVRTAFPLSRDAGTLNQLKALLAGLTLGGALVAGLVARLVAGRVLRPIGHLAEAVQRVTATRDLQAELPTGGRDEVASLARSFTVMTAALRESVLAQRRLVADASHELRTPLTSLITNLELLHEGRGAADPQAPVLIGEAREQSEELRVLVADLVELARHGDSQLHLEDTRL
ncbi:MAG: HAMP domain-containing histidine kinase, partial [Nonomuraea sp.]|nr:HAMP domain-containing histidine kinase [Nonomuraea sp.]